MLKYFAYLNLCGSRQNLLQLFMKYLAFDYLYCKFENFHNFHSFIFANFSLGLNEIYVWFLLPTYPIFSNRTLNIKMVFEEKIPKMGTFSDFVTIFFVKCYNKI